MRLRLYSKCKNSLHDFIETVCFYSNNCWVGLVVSVSASHTVGHEFASRQGHTKDHHKNGTNCLPAWHAKRLARSLTVQPDCLKGQVVCGTVYGDMHLKDLLESFVRVGYRIPVPDFYLMLHGLRQSTLMDQKNNNCKNPQRCFVMI